MAAPPAGQMPLVQSLSTLLRDCGDSVLDGTSTLTLRVGCLQHLTRLFEQYLLARTHQHGFLALPSHPADTASLLQVQFLFDMLQKTISLKLINPPGTRILSTVKIFPFKSLKYLELKSLPPHCLEGLRAVYSQLEAFICSKSLNSLEEILSLRGGDLSSALPWLELHMLNFSYNSIVSLDESLSLLNVLKSLDLSHNKIQECSEFLLPLTELEHLNLGYNFLQRVPSLGLCSRNKLVTLVLRNNELETINGVEQLCNLQHLDLSYNMLVEHSQLAPLSLLHCLHTLHLEGNPLYFQRSHRISTVAHISPKAAHLRLQLDGRPLSSSELAHLPMPTQLIGQSGRSTPPVAMVPERGVQELSSGGGEMSDSLSVSEPGVSRQQKKKCRSRVRVRRASISEPSDTDYEPRSCSILQDIVLHHQKDIERMDVFRNQLGEDWLRYHHHLEGAPSAESDPKMPLVTADSSSGLYQCDLKSPEEVPPAPPLPPEPREGASEPETESTLQWPGCSSDNIQSTIEMSLGLPQGFEPISTPEEEDDAELGVDLCLPLLVAVLPEEGDGQWRDRGPFFLRVKPGHALEVDVHSGAVLTQLELDSLQEVATSETMWTDTGEERSLPMLELHFSYISRPRQRRRYVMLDDDPQAALQTLADVLARVAEGNEQRTAAEEEEQHPLATCLQCLKCREVFSDCGRGQGTDSTAADGTLLCPECGSDHVVQLAAQTAPSTSTPLLGHSESDTVVRKFTFNSAPAGCGHQVTPTVEAEQQDPTLEVTDVTDAFLTARSSTFYIGSASCDSEGAHGFHSPKRDNQTASPQAENKDELDTSWKYCYSAPQLQLCPTPPIDRCSPAQFDLSLEDFEVVDHRLKLFLDVEVFEDNSEELRYFFKMSVVKFGDPEEFPALLVVSDQCFYFLEITSDTQGQPSDWLHNRERHGVAQLCYLEVGLGSQSVHMEFEEEGASYTLLVRDSSRCKRLFGLLTGIARELAPTSESKLQSISTVRLSPQHHLWPLVSDVLQPDVQLQFFYLLAFIKQDNALCPVTVLATQECLYLLNEDHQWCKKPPTAREGSVTAVEKVIVRENQPISCVSSIHQFSSNPFRVDIKLYDEVLKEEKVWPLKTESEELTLGLVDWVRTHWEAMFGVKLTTIIQELAI